MIETFKMAKFMGPEARIIGTRGHQEAMSGNVLGKSLHPGIRCSVHVHHTVIGCRVESGIEGSRVLANGGSTCAQVEPRC